MSVITRSARNINNKTRSTLYLTQPEGITGDGTYKSPNLYVAEVDPLLTEGVNYTGGSAEYTELDDIQVKVTTTVTVSSVNAGVDVTMTTGVDGSPDLLQEIENTLTNANDAKELTHQGVHPWKNLETLDFFIKASSNVTMEKAVFVIERYDD